MLYWLISAASLVGVILNIQRKRACFAIWLVTNVVWAIADFMHGLPAQGVPQAVYAALAGFGLWSWRRAEPRRN